MANITEQFVTSFSELYFSTTRIVANDVESPTEAEVRSWFDASATTPEQVQVTTLALSGTATAGTYNLTVDGTTFAIASTETAAADVAGDIRDGLIGLIDIDATVSGDSLVLTGRAGKGDFVVSAATPQNGLTISETVVSFVVASGGTQLVPLVMEIGTLSNEATVIDTPTFGEKFRGKLRGQLDGGQLDAQLYWAPRNAIHQELRVAAEDGTQVYVGIKWNSDANSTDSEFVYFDSFVSSFGIDTTFDDVAKVACTFVVDGAEHFASAS